VIVAIVVELSAVVPALAASRFAVASGGNGTTSNCTTTAGNPACTIGRAFAQATAGDTISIGAGTYPLAGTIDVTHKLTITATDLSGARPELDQQFVPLKLDTGSDGSTVSHIAFGVTGAAAAGVQVVQGATFSDDALTTDADCFSLFNTTQLVTFSNDTLTQSAAGAGYGCIGATDGGPVSISGSTVTAPASTAVALENGSVTDSTITGDEPALTLAGADAVARRDTIHGSIDGVELNLGALITDSVVTADSGAAVQADGPGTAENVTAIGTGPGAIGFQSIALVPPSFTAGNLTIHNSIARAPGDDVQVVPAPNPCILPPCTPGTLHIDHSDYATSFGTLDTAGGGNISDDPRFSSATDYHLGRGSPAIDAAAVTANTGTGDRDANPRIVGPSPDMGAYEFQPAAPLATTTSATHVGPVSATLTGAVDPGELPSTDTFNYGSSTAYGHAKTAPSVPASSGARAMSVTITGLQAGHTYHVQLSASNSLGVANGGDIVFTTATVPVPKLSHVKFAPASFHVTSKHKAATHIHFKLSEVATVRITLARHRALTLRGLKAGSHSIKFSGHVGKHVLKPGRYRATLVARASGAPKPSRSVHAKFRVLRSG
jgi:hypothetical protein